MQNNLRLRFVKCCFQRRIVPDITDDRVNILLNPCDLKQGRICWRIQGVTRHNRTSIRQHLAEPGAFEPRMTGDKYFFPL